MKVIEKIFLMLMISSSFLFSTVIEDAEDGTTNGWIASTGSTMSNVTDADRESKVIKLSSSIYTYHRMDNLNSESNKIKWDIKADESFIVYVSVMTKDGARLFYYTTLNRDYGVTSSGIHHGLGEAVKDGTWHTIERDLEAELHESEPDNAILKITSFKIRSKGDIFLDDITGYGGSAVPIVTRQEPHAHTNCLGYVEQEGYDLNDNGQLDANEVTSSTPFYEEGKPVTRAELDTMIDNDEDISSINTCEVTDMSRLFYQKINFNQDISGWNTGSVTTMRTMFFEAGAFNQDIGDWNVSNVTDMSFMFRSSNNDYEEILIFNQDIGRWDVSSVTNMHGMFLSNESFNQDIGDWNVSNVTNMNSMFEGSEMFLSSVFNQDIGRWDVSNVTDMGNMFHASLFNQDIGNWDVSNVTNMDSMFMHSQFNQDIGNWNVSNVRSMGQMFNFSRFNQDIGSWNVSSVTDMYAMFEEAIDFSNHNLSAWDVSNVENHSLFSYSWGSGNWGSGNTEPLW